MPARPRSSARASGRSAAAMRRTVSLGVAVVAAGALVAGCSSPGGRDDSSQPPGDAHNVAVTITAKDGCVMDGTTFEAGGLRVHVANQDATAVSEVEVLDGGRIIGEKENLPPGFDGEFAVTVQAGSYTLYCPGAATERQDFTVAGGSNSTGDVAVAALLQQASSGYAGYVKTQVGYLLAATKTLNTALSGTDLAAAQQAYIKARPFYEKIEPVAESFTVGSTSLDANVDAREGDVPASQWTGFHRVEKGLFADRSLTGLAPYGAGLLANVTKLQQLTATLTYQPTELANGAQELLDEVAATKITGEEERYSHIDLVDLANNIEGSEQAFAQLQPALAKIDPALTARITSAFTALDAVVDTYRAAGSSGFVAYSALDNSDKRTLAGAVTAVQEPLSTVAGKIAGQS